MPPGYIVDVPYIRTFVGNIAPPTLRLVAALNGRPTPPEVDFDYCELGSGNGDTLATLAAANPGARFVGVDFNPEHIAFANGLASGAGLGNARFLPRDFEELAGADVPALDFLVLHGVWSWISAATRRAILAFAEARLKPDGLLCVSYNALPGWAALEPLRRLMLSHTEGASESTLERAGVGLAFVTRVAAANAGYFASHPTARAMVDQMRKEGLQYLAHEYFGSEWRPMYFADVAREMARHGLGYVGQAPLHLNIPALAIPPAMKDLAKASRDRIAFETLKDFALNESFRTDVYAKGAAPRSRQEQALYFECTPFGTLAAINHLKRRVELPQGSLDYTGPPYDAILPVVANRASTAMELAQTPELARVGQRNIGTALQRLAIGGQVVPMRPAPNAAGTGPALKMVSSHNAQALEQALWRDGPLVLASPVTGSGVQLSIIDAIAIRLLLDVAPAERPAWVESFAARRSLPLSMMGRVVRDVGELKRLVAEGVEAFAADAVGKMVELGILARARE